MFAFLGVSERLQCDWDEVQQVHAAYVTRLFVQLDVPMFADVVQTQKLNNTYTVWATKSLERTILCDVQVATLTGQDCVLHPVFLFVCHASHHRPRLPRLARPVVVSWQQTIYYFNIGMSD